MTKREAKRLIYQELALTLKADVQDTGSWMHHGNSEWTEADIVILKAVAIEFIDNYLELSSLQGK